MSSDTDMRKLQPGDSITLSVGNDRIDLFVESRHGFVRLDYSAARQLAAKLYELTSYMEMQQDEGWWE